MWDRLSYPWQVCLENVWHSYSEGSIPIAAVITDSGGKILSVGRNRRAAKPTDSSNKIVGGPLAHAELNALLELDFNKTDIESCVLYTTVEPCPLCMGAICIAGLKTFHFAARDAWSGSSNLIEATPYFRWKQIQALGPVDSELETLIHMIQVEGQLSSNHPRVHDVLEVWRREYAEDVRMGEMLFETAELPRMCEEGNSAKEAITRICELMRAWKEPSGSNQLNPPGT